MYLFSLNYVVYDKKFNKDQIIKYELYIIDKLNYNISMPKIFDLFQFINVIKILV